MELIDSLGHRKLTELIGSLGPQKFEKNFKVKLSFTIAETDGVDWFIRSPKID